MDAHPHDGQYRGPPSSIHGTEQHGDKRKVTSGVCYLACYICGKPIGVDERIERWTHKPDSNGLGVIEACDADCDLARLTELETPLVDLGVPLEDEPK